MEKSEKEIIQRILQGSPKVPSFKEYVQQEDAKCQPKKIIVEISHNELKSLLDRLEEGKTCIIKGTPVRKDSPHFNGDEYHAHSELPGGYEVTYAASGRRRHPNKFPAAVPAPVKTAIASVLGISSSILESSLVSDRAKGKNVILVEASGMNGSMEHN